MTRQRLDLRAVRQAQGKGLRETAREAKVDSALLSRVEQDKQLPQPWFLIRVGRVLGLKNIVNVLEMVWTDEASGRGQR